MAYLYHNYALFRKKLTIYYYISDMHLFNNKKKTLNKNDKTIN